MDPVLLIFMVGFALMAVILYTGIGFIPGTDETSVLMPITLALVLAGFEPVLILSFFIAAIVTLNLTNTMPTALVGLPGGVMSSAMIEHTLYIKANGNIAATIKKMAAASLIGVLIAVPVSLLLAQLLLPVADVISPLASWLFVFGAIFLALISRHKILSLLSILPLAILFESLRALYWNLNIVPQDQTITVSFFLGITIGPLMFTLFNLLNKHIRSQETLEDKNTIVLPKDDKEKTSLNPLQVLNKEERSQLSLGALIVNTLFILSPVGLTILIGESFSKRHKDPLKKATMTVITMSAVIQATYISGIIIPLFALGIPLSPVAIGPGAALFNAPPVLSLDNNLHHLLSTTEFVVATIIGALVALSISYILISRYAKVITRFILKHIPHESVLGLFIAFILLLAFMDAGLINIFGVLLIGLFSGALNKMGVNFGVQFMALYAAPQLMQILAGG